MSKLSNVKGRISYITSHAKQENLYATYRTADNEFWSNLARESQQEFKRSGTEGKCIEARELIKITVLETAPGNAKELANEIADSTNSEVVQTVGNKITLFRQKKKNSKIEFPR